VGVSVWAMHNDLGLVCEDARIPNNPRSLMTPFRGQQGWQIGIPFQTLADLAARLQRGVPVPDDIRRAQPSLGSTAGAGQIDRLAMFAHGWPGGFFVDGDGHTDLSARNFEAFRASLLAIGRFVAGGDETRQRNDVPTIYLMGCEAGRGSGGTALLNLLSQCWRGRKVVGFVTIGLRIPTDMERPVPPNGMCYNPGFRLPPRCDPQFVAPEQANSCDIDRIQQMLANASFRPLDDTRFLSWANEFSPYAKVSWMGQIIRDSQCEADFAAHPPVSVPCPPRATTRQGH